jgi:hypothetical protein
MNITDGSLLMFLKVHGAVHLNVYMTNEELLDLHTNINSNHTYVDMGHRWQVLYLHLPYNGTFQVNIEATRTESNISGVSIDE